MVELTIHTYTAAESGLFVNSYLLETPAGAVVVDANLLVADIAALKARVAALHKPLLGVFLTHAHPDHFNGALELVRDREVPVHATSGVARAVREIADAKRAQWSPVYGAEWPTATYYPNTELRDGQQVTIDGLAITASELGQGESHADSYLLVQLAGRAGEPVAFTDDLAFHRTHPYTAPGLAAGVRPASGAAAPGAGGGRHTLGYGALAAVSLLQTAAGLAPAVLSLLGVALLGVAFLAALLTLRHPPGICPDALQRYPVVRSQHQKKRKRSNGH